MAQKPSHLRTVPKKGSAKDPPPRRKADRAAQSSVSRVWIGFGVIAATAFIVFSPALGSELQGWDDYNYIRDNLLIRTLSWENLVRIFSVNTIVVGNYHPLTVLSYILEYQVAGTKPFLYHFDNLLLHLANTGLVCLLAWRLTGRTWATLITAALFALHPMRVESVVWAAERKDVLYTFFFLLSLLSYISFLVSERGKTKNYLLSLLFFILSILSKGQAVVLPLVLVLTDTWFNRKISLKTLMNKVPFLILALASGVVALTAQHNSLTEQRMLALPAAERVIIVLFNVSAYLYKLIYPFNLSSFYPYPAPGDMTWVYVGAAVTVVLFPAAFLLFRRNRSVVFGLLFYLLTLSVVTQILPVGNAIIADRYTYIPYIGLFFMAAMIFDRILARKPGGRSWLPAIPVLVLAVFSVKSYLQAQVWHDNVSLWENAIRQNPKNGLAYNNLAQWYIEAGEHARAVPLLRKAVENEATFASVHHAYQNLGVALSHLGNDAEAIRNFSQAIGLRPAFAEAYFGRGLSLTALGRYSEAVADFSRIIDSLDPGDTRAYYSRGIALNRMNQPDQAITDYSTAIRLDPDYSPAYVNRGNIYYGRGNLDAALDDYTRALAANPDDGTTCLNRSYVLFRMKRYREALQDALRARELKIQVHPKYLEDLQAAISVNV